MAETTMEAIKKKMQAMRLEKESAFDRADHLEHRLLEQRYIYDKVHSVLPPPPPPGKHRRHFTPNHA